MLEVMRWTAAGWQPLQTAQAPDRYTYFTAQQITEPGIYAVMLKLPPAYSLRSQDLDSTGVVSGVVPVASIVQWGAAGPLDQALAGCTVLLVVDPQTQAGGSSRQYVPNAPAYVNTLQAFEAGKTYIVLVSANCTTTQTAASTPGQSAASTPGQAAGSMTGTEHAAGVTGAGPAATTPGQSAAAPVALTLPKSQMPALYYGVVRLPDGKPIAPGTRIQARVAGGAWGETRTFRVGADTVYVLSVAADDPRIAGPQGAQPGSTVEFVVGGATAPRTATWAGGTAAELNLTVAVASYRVFMPAVRR
jgi:hypothetical protein